MHPKAQLFAAVATEARARHLRGTAAASHAAASASSTRCQWVRCKPRASLCRVCCHWDATVHATRVGPLDVLQEWLPGGRRSCVDSRRMHRRAVREQKHAALHCPVSRFVHAGRHALVQHRSGTQHRHTALFLDQGHAWLVAESLHFVGDLCSSIPAAHAAAGGLAASILAGRCGGW